jgi:Uma2 family endonuclease
MAITQRRMTLEEFLKLPEEKPALEFCEGVVTQKVSPKIYHGRVQYKFAEFVNHFGEPRRLAMAFTETRSTFGGSSFVPDVGVFRWERLPRGPDGKLLREAAQPWDIAVEIRSPEQTRAQQVRRCRWYVAHGVPLAVLVDDHDESVTLFRPDGRETVLRGDDPIDLSVVLPGFELTPRELFASLYPA